MSALLLLLFLNAFSPLLALPPLWPYTQSASDASMIALTHADILGCSRDLLYHFTKGEAKTQGHRFPESLCWLLVEPYPSIGEKHFSAELSVFAIINAITTLSSFLLRIQCFTSSCSVSGQCLGQVPNLCRRKYWGCGFISEGSQGSLQGLSLDLGRPRWGDSL